MDITVNKVNNELVILKIIGRFNIEEVSRYESKIDEFIGLKTRYIALDMSEMKYIDSSGIGSLIKSMNMTKNEGLELILLDMEPEILNIFKLAYLDKFFTIQRRDEFMKSYIKK